MEQRLFQGVASGCSQQTVAWPVCLRRRLQPHAALQQPPVNKGRVTAQVAAVPAFTDDARPSRPGSPAQLQQQQSMWLPQPWSNNGQQQNGWQAVQQAGAPVKTYQQADQQQQQAVEQQQQHHHQQFDGDDPDLLLLQLQQCKHWMEVAQLVNHHIQEQHQQLSFVHVSAALQQLCSCTRSNAVPQLQRPQLDGLLTTLADAAAQQLQNLHHAEVGQMLAMFQVLGLKPSVAWVKSVLQHAGTGLVHYTPAELALLLLTATQTAARVASMPGGSAPPPLQLSRSSPTAAATVSIAEPAAATDASSPSTGGSSSSSSTAARRANTVLTSAWLQHFMTTFERYLACRTAHPQLQPQHLEAVITCLAALRVTPDRFWLYLFVRQMTAQLPACPPASVVRILSALASMGYRLPEHVISQIERQVGGTALASLRPQDCVEVVKSVAALKHKPSEAWLHQLLSYALKGSNHLSASAVVTLMVCTAALGMDLNPGWIDCLLMQARAALHVLSAPEHVGLIDALSQQQHRPGPVFMSLYMTQVQAHLPELSLGQQAVLIASLASVGYKPAPAWMAAFMGQLAAQPVTGGDAGELLKLLVALRRMQYVPTSHVAQQVEALIDGLALDVPYNQLQQLRAALADLKYRPYVAAGAVSTAGASIQAPASAPPAAAAAATGTPALPEVAAFAAVEEAASEVQQQEEQEEQEQRQQQQQQDSGASSGSEGSQRQQGSVAKSPSVMESLELFA